MEQIGITAGDRLLAGLVFLSNPLTAMTLLPLLGVLLIAVIPKQQLRTIKLLALLTTGWVLAIGLSLLRGLPASWQTLTLEIGGKDWSPFGQYVPFAADGGPQYEAVFKWMQVVVGEYQSFTVNYQVAMDGLSLPMVLMTASIVFLMVIWAYGRTERAKEFFGLLLVLETGLIGVFVAADLIMFYLFWELMLIPMYFLIAGWGKDKAKSARAAIKFFIFTVTGSVFMLITFIAMKVLSAMPSFSIAGMVSESFDGGLAALPFSFRLLMFLGLLIGFAVKVPMFPFHTWLPDAHTEAPTEISVILAAVMLKTGAYGFLRILYPMYADVAYRMGPIITCCAVVAIIYGAAVTVVQTDIKRMVAYSSISHMGFIVLGISAMNSTATIGAVYHMVGHGVIIATLFLLCGVIERRYGTRDLRELAGMWQGAPSYASLLTLSSFAAMGLPGLAGFWGEFLVLKGTYYNNPNWLSVHVGAVDGSRYLQIVAILAVLGILGAAVYMINMLQRVLPGDEPSEKAEGRKIWRGLKLRDALVLVPMGLAIIVLGVFPKPVIQTCLDYANMLWVTQLLK